MPDSIRLQHKNPAQRSSASGSIHAAPSAAFTIAKIPTLTASGSFGQTSITAAKSVSIGVFFVPTAPDSAALWNGNPVFPDENRWSSGP